MKPIITEELRLRKRICDYALSCGNNAEAARRYHTSRQNVSRWLKRYDGSVHSLRPHSRRPKSHSRAHTVEELALIEATYRRHKKRGLAEVYVRCRDAGYTRSYGSMCHQIRRRFSSPPSRPPRLPRSRYTPFRANYPGEMVQMDIKYVPRSCTPFEHYISQYYQITAIDLYTRKRVLVIVDECSVTHTSAFVEMLAERMGFEIHQIQTDNGREFTNLGERDRRSAFENTLTRLGIAYRRTRPYSPWQNGVVERSHRLDSENFYSGRRFRSEEELRDSLARYERRYNRTARRVLGFLSPDEMLKKYQGSHSSRP